MIVYLIRHGMTMGNQMKRYIGTTDEPLCPEGIEQLRRKKEHYMFVPDELYVSPMLRCIETADFLFPEITKKIISDFRECDFGLFENKNYLELSDCPEYQTWIESGGTLPFPGGEAVDQFKERCCLAFEKMVDQIFRKDWSAVNVVVHGGTIMSIMERYARPEKSYYEWHVENGRGYTLLADYGRWKEEKQMNYCIRF